MATIQVRIGDDDKKKAEKILKALGMDMTTAVRIFVKRITLEEGIPFPISTKRTLTVNGFTPEFEEEVLKAKQEEEGTMEFEDMDEAIRYLHTL